jgi:hypothetical protein
MSILNFLRKRSSGDGAHIGVGGANQNDDGQLPIPGYDRISDKHLVAELSKHSQAELTAIDAYERSHKNRAPVVHKLRYLRGQEPLQGYDDLSVKEILAGLEGADTPTLQRTRGYERKFQRRPDILEMVASALHDERSSGSQHRDPPRVTTQHS